MVGTAYPGMAEGTEAVYMVGIGMVEEGMVSLVGLGRPGGGMGGGRKEGTERICGIGPTVKGMDQVSGEALEG